MNARSGWQVGAALAVDLSAEEGARSGIKSQTACAGWQVGAALAVDLSAEETACSGAALEVAVDARGRLCGATMRARSAPLHPSSLQVGHVRPVT